MWVCEGREGIIVSKGGVLLPCWVIVECELRVRECLLEGGM